MAQHGRERTQSTRQRTQHSRQQTRGQGIRGSDLALTALLAAALPLAALAAHTLLTAAPGTDAGQLGRLLGLTAAVAGAALAAWWTVGVLGLALLAMGSRTGDGRLQRLGERITPAVLRRVGAAVLGVQLVGTPAAMAAEAPAWHSTSPSASTSVVDTRWWASPTDAAAAEPVSRIESVPRPAPSPHTGGEPRPLPTAAWTPGAPTTRPPEAPAAPRPLAEAPTVTVRAGDCLWDIAAAELGPDATALEIDRRWRDWYRANQRVIGPDPSLLTVGTVLVTPTFSPYAPDDVVPATTAWTSPPAQPPVDGPR
ncbi:LysM domain-containing protein [Micrococcus sp.]|uniref:LysM peptidoglycan-binding domain-containing protein n=1 Tax=Micrococcus sp. TaxID=1271 RepID=UPI002A90AC96|nr:LysM domain-containing protein [Micrococcus sp.]MDY6055898.1 LysM domain-containing protein [Micrococcus sp.]